MNTVLLDDPRFIRKPGTAEFFPRVSWLINSVAPKKQMHDARANEGPEAFDERAMKAAEEGSEIHDIAKAYFSGQPILLAGMERNRGIKLKGMDQFAKEFEAETFACEHRFYVSDYEGYRYSGQIDWIGKLKRIPPWVKGYKWDPDELWVIDFKTGARLYKDHDAQVTAYYVGCYADKECPYKPTRRAILHLREGRGKEPEHYNLKIIQDQDFSEMDWLTTLIFQRLWIGNIQPKFYEFDEAIQLAKKEEVAK